MKHRYSGRRTTRTLLLGTIAIPVCLACRSATPAPDAPGDAAATEAAADVLPGLEVLLRDSLHLIRGKRVGFLTNQTAVTRDGRSGIDLLHESPDFELVALYGPEHGLRGEVEGGVQIETDRDAATGSRHSRLKAKD